MTELLAGELLEDPLNALMLIGSRARADHHPKSDYDFYALVEKPVQTFESRRRQGVLVDVHYRTFSEAKKRIEIYKPDLYSFLEGRILHDPQGQLGQLKIVADSCFKSYRTLPADLEKKLHWLSTVQDKLNVSLNAGDVTGAGFLLSTTTWPLLETLFALNDVPTPSSSAVKTYLPTLKRQPQRLETKLKVLYTADVPKRADTLQDLITWLAREYSSH